MMCLFIYVSTVKTEHLFKGVLFFFGEETTGEVRILIYFNNIPMFSHVIH